MLGLAFGFLVALRLATLPRRRRGWLLLATFAALALPPFLVVNSCLDVFGANGALRPWLPLSPYGFGGAIGVLTSLLWPISAILILGAWDRVEPAQIEVDRELHGQALIRWVLWPAARRAAGLAATVTFVIAFNQFTVPVILQVPVFPEELWLALTTRLNDAGAWAAAVPLIIVPWLILLPLRGRHIAWPRVTGPHQAPALARAVGRGCLRWSTVATVLLLGGGLILPLAQLGFQSRTWAELPGLVRSSGDVVFNSFTIAFLTATMSLALGMVTRRWRGGWMGWMLFFVPGILLGQLLLRTLGETALPGTMAMALLAMGLRHLAIGWQGAMMAERSLDRDVMDAGRLEGARGRRLFRHYAWPQMSRSLALTWYVVYLLALWDVETLVLIHPPGGETLPLRIFQLLHYGHNAQVNAMCVLLLILALLPVMAWALARLIVTHRFASARIRPLSVAAGLVLLMAIPGCAPPSSNDRALTSGLFERAVVIGERGSALGQFNKPRSVAVDRQDNLYVVDMTGRVQKFSPTGEFLLSWQLPQTDLGKPKGMATDTNGNIIVLEPHYQRVNHFAPDGSLVAQWGRRGTNRGELILPRAAAVSTSGDIYLSEYSDVDRVQGFRAESHQAFLSFGQAGTGRGEFNRPEGLGLGPDDRLHVADSCNHRVQIFDRAGHWLSSYGRPGAGPGEMSYPYDVRVDRAGRQYVCEFGNSRIQVFDRDNRSLEIIGGPGLAPGRFNNPWSIALDSAGNLYVADSGNHRVQKLVRRRQSKSEQLMK